MKPPTVPFVFEKWEEDAVQTVFGVALDVSGVWLDDYTLDFLLISTSCVIQRDVAQKGKLVWLKALQEELIAEPSGMLPLLPIFFGS